MRALGLLYTKNASTDPIKAVSSKLTVYAFCMSAKIKKTVALHTASVPQSPSITSTKLNALITVSIQKVDMGIFQ